MKAMILAAGRGERLRPITDSCPKPLVAVGGKPLLHWHLEKLKRAGISEIIINSAYLGQMIQDDIGDGSRFGVVVTHSAEGSSGLETAGGIIKALPFFKGEDFLVVNGDTFIDADYSKFIRPLKEGMNARLYLVENPSHNTHGDFSLREDGVCIRGKDYTFSGVAVYSCRGFEGQSVCRAPLLPYFESWSKEEKMEGTILDGKWFDVGTIERLNTVNEYIKNKLI
ncbi:MAG: N-acetylmuramate alpha-1-phosphate uridylyltransferase MurU [Succinivibrio sp.]